LATDAQRKSHHNLPVPSDPLKSFDRFIIYTHLAIGFCLLVGLLTRLAALGGAAFLVTVVASQWPWHPDAVSWITGPTAVMYQAILLFSCVVLMTSGAGRWFGLDYFFQSRQLAESQKEQA
jgi:uncharacterized membrane protein YphA (DoxX/SURF4 family)